MPNFKHIKFTKVTIFFGMAMPLAICVTVLTKSIELIGFGWSLYFITAFVYSYLDRAQKKTKELLKMQNTSMSSSITPEPMNRVHDPAIIRGIKSVNWKFVQSKIFNMKIDEDKKDEIVQKLETSIYGIGG